ncbi:MAG: hypothetical protein H6732_03290 [Alphaproteobacteria bacterium]|nr:hypothetical protein [Alphaproteobacteria bacterium]
MASWNDVQAHMRSTYRLQLDEADAMSMAWAYEDGRTQKIVVRRFKSGTHDMVEFKSPFAKIGGPDPLELLRENARLPFGAVALSGETFLVVHNADLGGIDLPAFDALLAKVAGLADRLEAKHASMTDAF